MAEASSAIFREDRGWMYAGRRHWDSITPEWAEKTTEFVERAFRRVPPGRDVLCPCARCRNRRPRSKYDMQIHLGRNGFQPDYTVWVYHGESHNRRTAKRPKPSDDQPKNKGNLDGTKDVEAAGAGAAEEEVSNPQGAKTKKREVSVLHAYALSKLGKEDRIKWEYQRYLWEMEKLQQQQQNAPKRLRTSGAPTAELAEDEGNKDANGCASSSGSI